MDMERIYRIQHSQNIININYYCDNEILKNINAVNIATTTKKCIFYTGD